MCVFSLLCNFISFYLMFNYFHYLIMLIVTIKYLLTYLLTYLYRFFVGIFTLDVGRCHSHLDSEYLVNGDVSHGTSEWRIRSLQHTWPTVPLRARQLGVSAKEPLYGKTKIGQNYHATNNVTVICVHYSYIFFSLFLHFMFFSDQTTIKLRYDALLCLF